jgi:hypothetical protein
MAAPGRVVDAAGVNTYWPLTVPVGPLPFTIGKVAKGRVIGSP